LSAAEELQLTYRKYAKFERSSNLGGTNEVSETVKSLLVSFCEVRVQVKDEKVKMTLRVDT